MNEVVAPSFVESGADVLGSPAMVQSARFLRADPRQPIAPISHTADPLRESHEDIVWEIAPTSDPLLRLVQQPETSLNIADDDGEAAVAAVAGIGLAIASNSVGKGEASRLPSSDAGALLGSSLSVVGVRLQKRNQIVTDVRTRGSHVGQILASGSYWVPARADLDTLLNKIDSRAIEEMTVIKGPYSARLGPGLNFIDFSLIPAPRYDGFQSHGSSSFDFKANGRQWYGRQTVDAGSDNWGVRVSYGHQTGNDYDTGDGSGAGFQIPASYNSANLEAAFGWSPTESDHIDFQYLRLDQTGVEYPGMVFDMRFLATDAFELMYVAEDRVGFDLMEFEVWYNQTRFEGDTFGAGKNRQIPTLRCNLFPFDGSGDVDAIDDCILMPGMGVGDAITDAEVLTTGYSSIFSWGDEGQPQLSLGNDFRLVKQRLNDIEIFAPPADSNFPIPPSYWINPGLLMEYVVPSDSGLVVRTGGRVDFVATDADNIVPGVGETIETAPGVFQSIPILISDRLLTDSLDRHFTLWSFFATGEQRVDENTTLTGGFGFAQRAPTLTELYTAGSFINLLQSGLTTLTGDPDLRKERLTQIDLGINYDNGDLRGSVNGFYSWIRDYITFDGGLITEAQIGQKNNRVALVNTELATLSGVELFGELDLTPMLTTFATMSYIHGRDHTRLPPSRRRSVGARSGSFDPSEPLPSIAPLESVLGLRFHSAQQELPWSIEFQARVVTGQERIAFTLFERQTPGYTILAIRSFWQVRENLMLTGGVENLGDKFYRSHLDYRAGLGVFQPGVNAYFGSELTY